MALAHDEIEAHVFRSLGDSARRKILSLLAGSPGMSVIELCAHFPTSRFAVMKHLNVLVESGLVRRERSGTTKQLYVDLSHLDDVVTTWLTSLKGKKHDTTIEETQL